MELSLPARRSTKHAGRTAAPDFSSSAVEAHRESFATYAAHELRTPLAAQRALLELALADANTDAAAWREIGEDVLRACRQQERLLESCLTLARSRADLRRREPVDLAGFTAEALRAHDPGELERVAILEQARTSGDPGLVELLVANLVSNASRHNVVGGRIEVGTRTESGRAVLSVVNTGPQIPTGEIARLFQPFERLTSTSTFPGDGFGLGLTIVRAVADAHEALVTARAQVGGGLRVDVSFPALDR